MNRLVLKIFACAMIVAFLFAACPLPRAFAAAEEETIVGMVVKSGKGFAIEADEGDYIVKGKDLSKMVGKLVEVTGIITESDKGDVIEAKSVEEIRE